MTLWHSTSLIDESPNLQHNAQSGIIPIDDKFLLRTPTAALPCPSNTRRRRALLAKALTKLEALLFVVDTLRRAPLPWPFPLPPFFGQVAATLHLPQESQHHLKFNHVVLAPTSR